MPVGPMLHKLHCRKCGWETFYKSPGDLIVPMPFAKWARLPKACPKCGSAELVSETASFWENINPINAIKALL